MCGNPPKAKDVKTLFQEDDAFYTWKVIISSESTEQVDSSADIRERINSRITNSYI